MPRSTSPAPNGLLLDTNVLSLLAAANKLTLLHAIATSPLYISPHIAQELQLGLAKGVSTLSKALDLIHAGQIQILQPTATEKAMQANLPNKLAQGEAEAIAICRQRNMIFITRDRKAANYCEREGIGCIPLKDLLKQMLLADLLSQEELESILR